MQYSPLVGALITAGALACASQDTNKKELTKESAAAQKKVEEHLATLKAQGAKTVVISDTPELGKFFPNYQFVSVHFAEFPVARKPPEPLKSRNVFALSPDSKLQQLTEVKELENLFKTVVQINNTTPPEEPVAAWFRLSQEFRQDGYFKFTLDKKKVRVNQRGTDVELTGELQVVPEMGNKGSLEVAITFDPNTGKVTKVQETGSVQAGIRPRCQASRLLDPDPVIRAICEQDLLVMGRAAEEYLMEQRGKAGPALREAIDRVWRQIVAENR
jgi:hypothetical protein